jgi:glycosyltransferase involved in cell wall biosynthesis
MLESWSLKNSWYKKWLAWILYEQKNINSATVFQATSAGEAQSIRRLGYKQPIALIPNGVNLPKPDEQNNKQLLIQLFPELADKKWLLFLSRIHPKKGLDNLLYVWQFLAKKFSDWHLIIAGPDLIGYQAKLELLTSELELEKRVTFTGMLSGQIKASALSNADLFVLPTHSENFGIAIAESLAYGVPAIATQESPWQDLLEYSCGWWIEDNQKALANALVEGMELSEQERWEMGLRGQAMVQKKYSWDCIAGEMSKVYDWILRGGNPPNCIHFYKSS